MSKFTNALKICHIIKHLDDSKFIHVLNTIVKIYSKRNIIETALLKYFMNKGEENDSDFLSNMLIECKNLQNNKRKQEKPKRQILSLVDIHEDLQQEILSYLLVNEIIPTMNVLSHQYNEIAYLSNKVIIVNQRQFKSKQFPKFLWRFNLVKSLYYGNRLKYFVQIKPLFVKLSHLTIGIGMSIPYILVIPV